MAYDYQTATRLERLRNLIQRGTLTNGEVKTEISDILRDLTLNGISDEVVCGYVNGGDAA